MGRQEALSPQLFGSLPHLYSSSKESRKEYKSMEPRFALSVRGLAVLRGNTCLTWPGQGAWAVVWAL